MAITNRHNPAVLVIGHTIGEELAHWALPEKLAAEYGINAGGMSIQHLVRGPIDGVQVLRPFNALIICGLSLLNPDAPDDLQNDLTISQARLKDRLSDSTARHSRRGLEAWLSTGGMHRWEPLILLAAACWGGLRLRFQETKRAGPRSLYLPDRGGWD